MVHDKRNRTGNVADIRFDIHYFRKPLESRRSLLKLFIKIDKAVNGRQNDTDVQYERKKIVYFNHTPVDEQNAAAYHNEIVKVPQKIDNRVKARHHVESVFLGDLEVPV